MYDYKDDTKDLQAKKERLEAISELIAMSVDQKNMVNYILPNLASVM